MSPSHSVKNLKLDLGHLMSVVEVDELAVDVVLELVEVSLHLIVVVVVDVELEVVVEVGLHLYDQRKKLGLVV